jgi:DNA-binding response OmpR family regulator
MLTTLFYNLNKNETIFKNKNLSDFFQNYDLSLPNEYKVMKILIIEDEDELLVTIKNYLTSEGFLCETASSYFEAEDSLSAYTYDIVVLDLTLPGGNGLDLIRLIKDRNRQAGLLIVSAKNSLDDKIKGLDMGADDYISKPFHLAELNSRIKSLARRRHYNGTNEFLYNEIKINVDSNEVSVNGEIIDLTKKEYDILLYLMVNRNKLITRESIAEHVWGDNISYVDNFDFIYSHIKNLRKKIEQKNGRNYLHNIYGIGYKFSDK